MKATQIAKFMGPTWGPPGSSQPQMGPMLAPWTLLLGYACQLFTDHQAIVKLQRKLCITDILAQNIEKCKTFA